MITRTRDGVIAGVCAGMAKRLDLEPWLVRFLFVCSLIFFGTGLFFYLLLMFSLPREDRLENAYQKRIMGVCASIARRSDLDVGLTRFLALIVLFTSFGWAIVVYVILYFVIPMEEKPPQVSASPEPSRNEASNT